VQVGTWVTMIQTPAVLTLLRAAELDFAQVDMEHSGRGESGRTGAQSAELLSSSGGPDLAAPASERAR
jgi:hypothetical protein